MATEQYCGPVNYVVFAFPQDSDLTSGLEKLLKQVDQGTIEILDFEFITNAIDGSAQKLSIQDALGANNPYTELFAGAESAILDDEDLAIISAQLEPKHIALAIIYEDRSLTQAAQSWAQAGGMELFAGGVSISDLEHTLEEGTLP